MISQEGSHKVRRINGSRAPGHANTLGDIMDPLLLDLFRIEENVHQMGSLHLDLPGMPVVYYELCSQLPTLEKKI